MVCECRALPLGGSSCRPTLWFRFFGCIFTAITSELRPLVSYPMFSLFVVGPGRQNRRGYQWYKTHLDCCVSLFILCRTTFKSTTFCQSRNWQSWILFCIFVIKSTRSCQIPSSIIRCQYFVRVMQHAGQVNHNAPRKVSMTFRHFKLQRSSYLLVSRCFADYLHHLWITSVAMVSQSIYWQISRFMFKDGSVCASWCETEPQSYQCYKIQPRRARYHSDRVIINQKNFEIFVFSSETEIISNYLPFLSYVSRWF